MICSQETVKVALNEQHCTVIAPDGSLSTEDSFQTQRVYIQQLFQSM